MNVAFCINKLALVGLGSALVSMIRNCSDAGKLTIYILCADLNGNDKKNINRLLSNEHFSGKLVLIDFDPKKHFGNLRSLHGDWTSYGRLLLPDLVHEESILYLDSDMIIENDVLDAAATDISNYAFAAVDGGTLQFALEHHFYIDELGIPAGTATFNAGVLLLNLNKWRQEKIKDKCLSFGSLYPDKLLSCDQTILNALYAGNFSFLPQNFNCPWYAYSTKPVTSDKMIVHFVGSPKPWDIFGRYIHKGHRAWKAYLTLEWNKRYYKFGLKDIARAWKIGKSYIRAIKQSLK